VTVPKAIRSAIKDLLAAGYVEVNCQGGKHRKFQHTAANHWITLPYRPRTDVLYGSLRKDVNIAVELGRKAQ